MRPIYGATCADGKLRSLLVVFLIFVERHITNRGAPLWKRYRQLRMDRGRSCGDRRRMSPRIEKLRMAIETTRKCTARNVASEHVIELFNGELAWDGVEGTFAFPGHPKAKRGHALMRARMLIGE